MDLTLSQPEMLCLWRLLEQVNREAFLAPEPDEPSRYSPSCSIRKGDWLPGDRERIQSVLFRIEQED